MVSLNIARNVLAVPMLIVTVGCSVKPVAMQPMDFTARADRDLVSMYQDQEVLSKPVSMSDAIARALKYNLDYRVKLMEQAQAEGDLQAAKYDLLPSLTLAAGYTGRDRVAGSSSTSLLTNTQSLEPSTSQDNHRNTSEVGFVWNVLDFGVGYASAKQRADTVLIAQERKRKAIQNIMQDVRYAWWRAVAAQKLQDDVAGLIEESHAALKNARTLEEKGLKDPREALVYQRGLLQAVRELWTIRRDLSVAKTELATLMNLKPGTDYTVAVPASYEIPRLEKSVDDLEKMALAQRPELREQDYQVRIDQQQIKKAMLRMLPGLEITLKGSRDSNSFLVNNSWSEAGLSISWNLFSLLSAPANKAAAEDKLKVTEGQRMALSMAVVTQVNLAWQRYQLAKQNFSLSRELADVEARLERISDAGQRTEKADKLSYFKDKAAAVVARMRQDLAYAELQNSFGRIINSLGTDPLPSEVAGHDVDTLSRAIAVHLQKMQRDELSGDNSQIEQGVSVQHRAPQKVEVPADSSMEQKVSVRPGGSNTFMQIRQRTQQRVSALGDGHYFTLQLMYQVGEKGKQRVEQYVKQHLAGHVDRDDFYIYQYSHQGQTAYMLSYGIFNGFSKAVAYSKLQDTEDWLQAFQPIQIRDARVMNAQS